MLEQWITIIKNIREFDLVHRPVNLMHLKKINLVFLCPDLNIVGIIL